MNADIDKLFLKTEDLKNELINLSIDIHSNPEIKWKEFDAVKNIKSLLEKYDIKVAINNNYPTAFVSSFKNP